MDEKTAKPKLIDTHCHLHFNAFDKDRNILIDKLLADSIWTVNVGTDVNSSKEAVALANHYEEGLYAAVGIHPFDTGVISEPNWNFLKELALNKKTVAIGECGLDYFRINNKELKIKQKEVFLKQIELAKEISKPLIIHCRSTKGYFDAYYECLEILKKYYLPSAINNLPNNGVIHFYQGDLDIAEKFIELGFFIAFSGIITYNEQYNDLIKSLSLNRILAETDSPFAAPVPHRGRRNEPAYIIEVVKKIAIIKKLDIEEAAVLLNENARKLFNLGCSH